MTKVARPVWRFEEDIWVILYLINKNGIPFYTFSFFINPTNVVHYKIVSLRNLSSIFGSLGIISALSVYNNTHYCFKHQIKSRANAPKDLNTKLGLSQVNNNWPRSNFFSEITFKALMVLLDLLCKVVPGQ